MVLKMKKNFIVVFVCFVVVSCFGQSNDTSIYPQWLVGTWIEDGGDRNRWTFSANGTCVYDGRFYDNRYLDQDKYSYVLIENVIAYTRMNDDGRLEDKTYVYDFVVSKDRKVIILKGGLGSGAILRKK